MRLTTPTSSARIGSVEIRGLQRVLELEALDSSSDVSPSTPQDPYQRGHCVAGASQSISPADLYNIQSRTAIVVPCKDECLNRIYGVWAAIPASSLIVLVSASEPDAYARERVALADFCRSGGRNAISIHQQDPEVAGALRAVGLPELLDDEDDGLVHRGKGEAMAIGIALAATARGPAGTNGAGQHRTQDRCGCGCGCGCGQGEVSETTPHAHIQTENTRSVPGYYKYIGFVDADNFVPGSVQEYCRAFSAGLHLAQTEDSMVRISWASKPKIHNGKLEFKQSGRSSEIVNQWLNELLKKMDADIETAGDDSDGAEATDLICTGNAGEHAMTISLALKLRVANGYAIEPFHFLDIFERFVGEKDAGATHSTDKRIEKIGPIFDTTALPVANSTQPSRSPTPTSQLTSPAESPVDGSPVLSASEDSTLLTLPSVRSPGQANAPEGQQLPASITSIPCYPATGVQAFNDMTPPISPTSAARPRTTVQILQIRTINPHFHENKGETHVARMWKQGLSAIYHSPLIDAETLTQYREDLRSAIFGGGGDGDGVASLPTPPFSNSVSVATTPFRSADDSSKHAAVIAAAANWQPQKCRIYPPMGGVDLLELTERLEGRKGSFWWSGTEEAGVEGGTGGMEPDSDPGLSFNPVDVLGLGPVSREMRPEGDVDGFKADVDEGR